MILRGFLAVVAVAALAIAVLWTYALVDVLGSVHDDPAAGLAGYERRSLIILAALGIAALLAAAGSGLAYARTAAPAWIIGVVAGILYAIPLLVVWIDLGELFTGSN